jgi:hypothetical protein
MKASRPFVPPTHSSMRTLHYVFLPCQRSSPSSACLFSSQCRSLAHPSRTPMCAHRRGPSRAPQSARQKMHASIARDPQIGNLRPERDTNTAVTQASANLSRIAAPLTQTPAGGARVRGLAPWVETPALASAWVNRRLGASVNARQTAVNCAQMGVGRVSESLNGARTTLLTPKARSVSSGFAATANRRGFVGFTASTCLRTRASSHPLCGPRRVYQRASGGVRCASCSLMVRWPAVHGSGRF